MKLWIIDNNRCLSRLLKFHAGLAGWTSSGVHLGPLFLKFCRPNLSLRRTQSKKIFRLPPSRYPWFHELFKEKLYYGLDTSVENSYQVYHRSPLSDNTIYATKMVLNLDWYFHIQKNMNSVNFQRTWKLIRPHSNNFNFDIRFWKSEIRALVTLCRTFHILNIL